MLHLSLYFLGGLLAQLSQRVGQLLALGSQLLALSFLLAKCLVAVFDVLQLLLQCVALVDELLNAFGMILLLQFVETVQPSVDGVQFGRVEVGVLQ